MNKLNNKVLIPIREDFTRYKIKYLHFKFLIAVLIWRRRDIIYEIRILNEDAWSSLVGDAGQMVILLCS